MATTSTKQIDSLAQDVLLQIDNLITEQGIIESILETYAKVCDSANARRLSIDKMPINSDMYLRLRFECLCFCVFLASLQTSKYFKDIKWFVKRASLSHIKLFDGAIASVLIKFCNDLGMSGLREIELATIDPKPTFGFGDNLDPLDRLEEYRATFVNKRGNELERFSKWIGKSLNAPNYPLFEMIGGSFGALLVQISKTAMGNEFKPCRLGERAAENF